MRQARGSGACAKATWEAGVRRLRDDASGRIWTEVKKEMMLRDNGLGDVADAIEATAGELPEEVDAA